MDIPRKRLLSTRPRQVVVVLLTFFAMLLVWLALTTAWWRYDDRTFERKFRKSNSSPGLSGQN